LNDQSDRIAASIRQRLLNLSRARKEDFLLILTQYAVERILYRISQTHYKDRFVLKGAQLFRVWTGHNYRPTRDLDLLGSGESSEDELRRVFPGYM
jgi:predicted nucleotidyltransferase component of viral defense system